MKKLAILILVGLVIVGMLMPLACAVPKPSISLVDTTSNSITIRWTMFDSPLFEEYVVHYKKVSSSGWSLEHIPSRTSNSITLDNLQSDTNYIMYVETFEDIIDSSYLTSATSDTFNAKTDNENSDTTSTSSDDIDWGSVNTLLGLVFVILIVAAAVAITYFVASKRKTQPPPQPPQS